jgi:hypothetical protein
VLPSDGNAAGLMRHVTVASAPVASLRENVQFANNSANNDANNKRGNTCLRA